MGSSEQEPEHHELPPEARRAVRVIYIVMAVMILLPILLIWLLDIIRFGGS